MALFSEYDLRYRSNLYTVQKSESTVDALFTKSAATNVSDKFDIFLSHSFNDQKLILGIWLTLEDMGYKVYVDWIHDRTLSRDQVTSKTALVLRERMLNSRCLFFATTSNSSQSKWMPWELGFKDGHNRRSAIFPVTQEVSRTNDFYGQEYLGIYPYVTKDTPTGENKEKLWIQKSRSNYVLFDRWLNGHEPTERT